MTSGQMVAAAAVGAPTFAAGVWLLAAVLRAGWAASERARATVIDNLERDDEGGKYYVPVARFEVAGARWTVEGLVAYGRPYRVGRVVTVYYPKGRPSRAIFRRFEGWWIGFTLAILGAAFLYPAVRELVRAVLV
jgi:hypothetical protein